MSELVRAMPRGALAMAVALVDGDSPLVNASTTPIITP